MKYLILRRSLALVTAFSIDSFFIILPPGSTICLLLDGFFVSSIRVDRCGLLGGLRRVWAFVVIFLCRVVQVSSQVST